MDRAGSESTEQDQYRVTVMSIGKAPAIAAKVIAEGLNTPAEHVAQRLYRAPSILADKLDYKSSQTLATLLRKLGVDVAVEASSQPAPPPTELFDVSIHMSEIDQLPKVAEELSAFLGIDLSQVIHLLITPPAIILGSVSQATLIALSDWLDLPGVKIISSRPLSAQYDLYTDQLNTHQTQQINQFLQRLNLSLKHSTGISITDLDYATAQTLWKNLGHRHPIKIVNTDFYRFDLLLKSLPEPEQHTAQSYLHSVTGITPQDYPSISPHLPLVIEESLTRQECVTQQTAYQDQGLNITTRNITFQRLKINLHSATDLSATNTLLHQLGLANTPITHLPYTTSETTETYARFVKHLLENSGADVSYQEVLNHGQG